VSCEKLVLESTILESEGQDLPVQFARDGYVQTDRDVG